VKKTTHSPVPKYREQENRMTSDRDQDEPIRELEELQRSLAERIRKIERAAEQSREDKTA